MRAVVVAAVAFAAAWVGTWCYRRWALRVGRIDVPGARSSHAVATPTGGGAGIVTGCLAALAAAFALGNVRGDWLLVFGLALGMAALGHADDRRALPVLPRLLGQSGAAAAVVLCALAESGPGPGGTGFVLLATGLLALVWLVNAFNFMDGIDGIAGGETIFIGLAAAGLMTLQSPETLPPEGTVALFLAAATAGFLFWNWPPARIFMGDVGSGVLGFVLAVLALSSAGHGTLSLPVWLILAGVFLVDTTLTLLSRLWRGERWYEAHRSHAYQRAARRWGSHRRVTLGVLAINCAWLLPLAGAATLYPQWGGLLLALAYLPLCIAALRLGAGQP